jgi:MauM/NapG family ferredoxin protein
MENKPNTSKEAYRPGPWRGWVLVRRLSQIFFLLLFLLLFLNTVYTGDETLHWPSDLFFRFDPLILTTNLLNFGPIVWKLFLSLILVGLTLVLGRFFCGWICPLGTTLDGCRRLLFSPRPDQGYAWRWRRVKYYFLFFLLTGALLSVNLVGLFDPLSLLFRTLGIVIYPGLSHGLEEAFTRLYNVGTPLTYISEPVYEFLKATILPFRKQVFLLPFFTLCCFAIIVALERVDRRFWCRALCPLGALYGLVARFSWLRRRPGKLCADCGDCQTGCKMGAIQEGEAARHQTADCQLCLSCLESCQNDRITFAFGSKTNRPPLDLGRRQVLTGIAAGVAAVPLIRLGSMVQRPNEFLLRPPGVEGEEAFLSRCIRCGECFKVCPTGGLQPTWWEAGLEGLYTSRLVPRLGYCEYNCTLCSQVCPTRAIPKMSLEVKHNSRMGTAFINHSRCIPATEGRDCLVCEEHCPVAPKAITYYEEEVRDLNGKKVRVKLPLIVQDQCIGCGTCENKCPVGGEAAIRVKRSLRVEI